MPELPEVETIARGLDRRIRGESIASVWIGDKPQPLQSPAREIAQQLEGATIAEVRRVGKHIVVDLEGRGQWIVHLGMTGKMTLHSADDAIVKHTHLIARLRSGRELRFVDARRFGRLAVRGAGDAFAGPGREPLTIGEEEFILLFRGRRTPIKAALLNQKLLHGVGNIYADESLFRARIRPRRQAGRLTAGELRALRLALRRVLREAIRLGGSSVSDYVDADGEEGFFQLRHRVYLRTGEPCLVCKTAIRRMVIAGRGTHFCPECQK